MCLRLATLAVLTRHRPARFVRVAGVVVQAVAQRVVVLHAAARVGSAQSGARVDALLRHTGLAGGTLGVRDTLWPAAGRRVALVAGQAAAHGHVAVVLALGVGTARRRHARVGGNGLPRRRCKERRAALSGASERVRHLRSPETIFRINSVYTCVRPIVWKTLT